MVPDLFRSLSVAKWILFAICAFYQSAALYGSTPLEGFSNSLAKKQWISKAARTLRYQKPVTGPEMSELLGKSRDEILDYFMAGSPFHLKVLDFYLYYLGRKTDRLLNYGELNFAVRSNRQAIHAIVEFVQNNNFEAVFSGDPLNWGSPLKSPVIEGDHTLQAFPNLEAADLDGLADDEKRKKVIEAYFEILNGWLDLFKQGEFEKACESVSKLVRDEALMYSMNRVLGSNNTLTNFDSGRNTIFNIAYTECEAPENLNEQIVERLKEAIEQQTNFFNILVTLPSYPTLDQTDFTKYINYRDYFGEFIEDFQKGPFSFQFWQEFTNSSTNFNRKRAAHILSTYFCDNLTPINIVASEEHEGSDVHASDPACQSCHYKLDPMAGFFKPYGLSGFDILKLLDEASEEDLAGFREFAGVPEDVDKFFVFDDNATFWGEELENYFNTWRHPTEPEKWNIGYIRSAKDPSLNTYGESIEDLFKIIQTAPEANKCMVKRLTQFYLGTDQVYSDAWLTELTDTYTSASNKSLGAKTVIKELVKSKTFATQNPDPNQCYDFGSNEIQENRPPCAIAAILERNCTKCHNQSNTGGNLNLAQWQPNSSGILTFPHTDEDGNELSKDETLARISDRLSTSDPNLQMPLITHMSPQDREALFLWVEENSK